MAAFDNFNSNLSTLEQALVAHSSSIDSHVASKTTAVNQATAVAEQHMQNAADKLAEITAKVTAETAKLNGPQPV